MTYRPFSDPKFWHRWDEQRKKRSRPIEPKHRPRGKMRILNLRPSVQISYAQVHHDYMMAHYRVDSELFGESFGSYILRAFPGCFGTIPFCVRPVLSTHRYGLADIPFWGPPRYPNEGEIAQQIVAAIRAYTSIQPVAVQVEPIEDSPSEVKVEIDFGEGQKAAMGFVYSGPRDYLIECLQEALPRELGVPS